MLTIAPSGLMISLGPVPGGYRPRLFTAAPPGRVSIWTLASRGLRPGLLTVAPSGPTSSLPYRQVSSPKEPAVLRKYGS